MLLKSKIKSIAVAVLTAGFIAAGPAMVVAQSNNGNSNPGNKVTICHATGSQTNPYEQISPDANGVISGHIGASHQGGKDIIPPFDYNDQGQTKHFAGQNYDASGQATLSNGCVVAAGQGGGGNEQNTNSQGQVLSGSTSGQNGAQVNAPQGSVNGGGGGASAFSLASLQRTW
jgi:hypothetical protein